MKRLRSVQQQQQARKRRLQNARKKMEADRRAVHNRIKHSAESSDTPMFRARNIQFEIAERSKAICYGGLGLMHSLARQCGLIEAIDRHVQLLQFHSSASVFPIRSMSYVGQAVPDRSGPA